MKGTFDNARSRSLRPSSTGDYRVLIAVAHLSLYHATSSLLYLTYTSSYFDEIWCNQSSAYKGSTIYRSQRCRAWVISIVPCRWVNLHSFWADLYDRFAVYFFTLCRRTLTSWFLVTVAVASSVFCCYSPPSAEANAVVRAFHRRDRWADGHFYLHVCCVGRSLSQHSSSLFTITSYTITVLSLRPSLSRDSPPSDETNATVRSRHRRGTWR